MAYTGRMTEASALTAAAGPAEIAATPPLTPPTVSLLTSSQTVIEPDENWTRGISMKLEGCGSAHGWDPCNIANDTKCLDPNAGSLDFHPYMVYSTNQCNTWGLGRALEATERSARSVRQLLAAESYVIEQELWGNGLGTTNPDLVNPKIQSPTATTLTTGPITIVQALAAIEDALGDCGKGGRYMIHMRPGMLVRLLADGGGELARREGNYYLSPMDNIIVPGRGYNGGAPGGAPATADAEWIYATSMVSVRRGPIHTIDQIVETVDRKTNTHVILNERWVLAAFDPTCCHLALQVAR